MKRSPCFTRILCALAWLALATFNAEFSTAYAQGTTAFTYQGRLNTGTNAANGAYDMTFAVYDANVGGNLIAGPITNSTVAVSNGLFTATLDFGPGVFTGTNYWVQMGVSPAGAGTFSTLMPRQQLTPAPYALSLISTQSYALCPAGSVMAYMGTTAPPGWLLCDGSAVGRSQYAALFAVLGTASGAGDGSTTFNLPDMRGVFLRGVDGGRGMDLDGISRTVGTYQADMLASHSHPAHNPFPGQGFLEGTGNFSFQVSSGQGLGFATYTSSTAAGGTETRPKNVDVNYIIKY
jgi:microcystin-dependent protein